MKYRIRGLRRTQVHKKANISNADLEAVVPVDALHRRLYCECVDAVWQRPQKNVASWTPMLDILSRPIELGGSNDVSTGDKRESAHSNFDDPSHKLFVLPYWHFEIKFTHQSVTLDRWSDIARGPTIRTQMPACVRIDRMRLKIEEDFGFAVGEAPKDIPSAIDFRRPATLPRNPLHQREEVEVCGDDLVQMRKAVITTPADHGPWQGHTGWATERFREYVLHVSVERGLQAPDAEVRIHWGLTFELTGPRR